MTEIDELLTHAGERWRAVQPEPPAPDVHRLAPGRPAVRRWAPLAAVVAVAAVVTAIVVPLATHRAAPPVPPGSTTPPPSSGAGSPMEGVGYLVHGVDGITRLCAGPPMSLTIPDPPSEGTCRGAFVRVTGADGPEGHVRAEGTYHAGVLAATRIIATPAPEDDPPFTTAVPCPAPAGGWRPGRGTVDVDSGREDTALRAKVLAQPDRFAEPWTAYPGGFPSAGSQVGVLPEVWVVGTTGDVQRDRSDLTAIFTGNLCVTGVTRSQSDLDAIVTALSSINSQPIEATIAPDLNKVRVRVVALDPATGAILDSVGRDALIVEEPLLRWLD